VTTAVTVSVQSVESLLLVVPPEPGAAASVSPAIVVAGLPLLRRIVLAGSRAGFSRVLVQGRLDDAERLLGGTAARALAGARPPDARHRIVILPANVVPQPRWLRALREAAVEPERLHTDGQLTAVIETGDPSIVLATAARCRDMGELLTALRARFDESKLDADQTGRFPMIEPGDARPAEAWLLRSLIKQREGFMSRHFERKISLAITRRLAATNVTPDVITLVSVGIGLLGASFFLSSSSAYQLLGALLFLTHSILDGCDGELARLKFMESPRGAILDFWGDNVVHVGVFACMAVGLSFAQEATWPLALGALTVLATLGAAASQSRAIMLDTAVGADAIWIARCAEAFSHRDFIYLVIALAALGKAHVFLILASIGTPIFFVLLLWVGARRRA
jgi:1L-myo-inositol 1-phosphate cytidylyltransferase / CDP-L-myo-inositol myo-inositolphosphotransferase